VTTDIDAGAAGMMAGSGDTPELKRLEGDCFNMITDRKWTDLKVCADQADRIKPGAGQQYRAKADLEIGARNNHDSLVGALKERDLKSAQKYADKIPEDSVYSAEAKKDIGDKKAQLVAEGVAKAKGYARGHKCDELDKFVAQESSSLGDDIGQAISGQVKCEAAAAVAVPQNCSAALVNPRDAQCKAQFCAGHANAPQCGSTVAPPQESCEELLNAGTQANGNGDNVTALRDYEKAFQCNPQTHTIELAFMAACNGGNILRARFWWRKLTPESQNKYVSMCVHNHVTRDQLDAPP
jgi:hypothetical protein